MRVVLRGFRERFDRDGDDSAPDTPAPSDEARLLTEIRDLLREQPSR